MGNTNTKPFGVKDKIGYMCGDIANDFTFIFASSYVMVFYTKVMGVSAGMVGTMFLLARCLDARSARICSLIPRSCTSWRNPR